MTLAKFGVEAKKSFGQHFLHDPAVLNMIVQEAEISSSDVIVEIGPGTGALTDLLVAKKPKQLLLIERDPTLIAELEKKYAHYAFVFIVPQDVLTYRMPEDIKEYKVVANIPYYVTSAIIKKFLLDEIVPPERMVLLVQKEVAEKATQVAPKATSFGTFIQFCTDPELVAEVSRNSFTPPPKVDSAILVMKRKNTLLSRKTRKKMLSMVERAFASGRKKLLNTLDIPRDMFTKYGIQNDTLRSLLERRPEELSLKDWQFLMTSLYHEQEHST